MKDLLNLHKIVKLGEILIVFVAAIGFIWLMKPFAGESIILNQAIVWVANILMLALIWLGIKLRGQKLSDFGLTFGRITFREGLRTFLLSLLVFISAIIAFVLGSIIMANITGIPEKADMSNYAYLQDNIVMLLLSLCGVYIVSSFGEEVIYRAFIINRLTELGFDSKNGRIVIIIISAVIFGLVHYEWGPMGIVQTGFMGLALGFFYIKLKKKLWILILAHAYMDTILMVQMYLASN